MKINRKNRGFTLIEVLIALFILGLGIAALYNLFPLGWQALAHSRKLNEVYLLAQKKLEELKTQESLTPGSGQEQDLSWSISVSPLKLQDGIEVIFVQLDVDFVFQKIPQKQRFITYIAKSD